MAILRNVAHGPHIKKPLYPAKYDGYVDPLNGFFICLSTFVIVGIWGVYCFSLSINNATMNIFGRSFISEHLYKVHLPRCWKDQWPERPSSCGESSCSYWEFLRLLPNGATDKYNHNIRLLQIMMNIVKERFRLIWQGKEFSFRGQKSLSEEVTCKWSLREE